MAIEGPVTEREEPQVPVLAPGHSFGSVTDQISSDVLTRRHGWKWAAGFSIGVMLVIVLSLTICFLVFRGIGIWGVNIPIGWGFAIANFVWWIGIGHAGTLISAILLLLHQQWRTSINRFAEAMTIFAVACAGLFPLMHLGRPWFFYWLFPYPATMEIWPQFRSPLVWDVFAVSTYFTVSLLFWFAGLMPDFATLRDRATTRVRRVIYGILSMGWRGSALHWDRYQMAYLLMAGLATPLVVSVHTVVSFDFTMAILPGWHSTIFPPYFVAGAIYSGFAMVLTIAIPLRSAYGLQDFITLRHMDNCAKVMLATGLIVAYGYIMELFMAWYSGDIFEQYTAAKRITGPYGFVYWTLIICNVLLPQALWSRRVRRNTWLLFLLSLVINLGMWAERVMIVITATYRDFLPSSWGMYWPTIWDWAALFGSLGLFVMLLYLFIRYLPVISMTEMRALVSETKGGK